MPERYDVIVVGARVGGSALAALLGDQGVSVLLLDRAQFPSTTSSTHFFRGAGMVGVLERLGVLDAVLDLGCHRSRGSSPTRAGERSRLRGLPRIQARSATVSRYAVSRSTSRSWSGHARRKASTSWSGRR